MFEPALVCIGNLTIDEAVHNGERTTPVMGGDAAYAALAARLHAIKVRLFAPVGNDLPPTLLELLTAVGIRADGLPERDLPTVRNIIDYHANGSRAWTMLASDADFDTLSVYPVDVPDSVLEADGILISAMSLESQLALTPWLRANTDATIYLDVQEDYLVGTRDALCAIIAQCDVFMPSEVEAVALAETTDLVAAAHFFAALGPTTVVIKLAERGCLVLDGDIVTEVPSATVAALDSTGAGDAFCGAFAAVHLRTADAVKAAIAGSAAARIAISAYGIAAIAAAATEVASK